MSPQHMEPLAPELASLLDAERARPMAPEVDPDALFDALTASLDLDAPASPTAGDGPAPRTMSSRPPTAMAGAVARAGAAKALGLAAAFTLGAVTGAGAYATLRRPERVVVDRVVRVPVERVVRVPVERVVEAPAAPLARPSAPSPTAPAAAPRAAPAAGLASSLDREIALIDQATAALARDNLTAALASVREHQRRFPDGAMREDRERLWIDVLARSGHLDEARARAAEFGRSFPQSVYRTRIARALAGGVAE